MIFQILQGKLQAGYADLAACAGDYGCIIWGLPDYDTIHNPVSHRTEGGYHGSDPGSGTGIYVCIPGIVPL